MRRPHATITLFLLTLVACDDPTLFIGYRPDGGGPTNIVVPEDPEDPFEDEDEGGADDGADDGQSTDDGDRPTGAVDPRPAPSDPRPAPSEETTPEEPTAVADAGAPVAPPSTQQPAPSGRDGGPGFPPPPFPNPFADGGLPIGETGVGLTGIGLDWTTWPPRIRFQLSCRFDSDCRRVRQGVCVNSRCVECRTAAECPQAGATCTEEHICVVR